MSVHTRQIHTTAVVSLVFSLCTACTDTVAPEPKVSDPSAIPIASTPIETPVGTAPAGPSVESPATKSAVKSEISTSDQSQSMPMPGQANDHSTLASPSTKKSAVPGR